VESEDCRQGESRHALVESADIEGAIASVSKSIEAEPLNDLRYRERAHLHLFLVRLSKRDPISMSPPGSRTGPSALVRADFIRTASRTQSG
jgi:hypothetical protein